MVVYQLCPICGSSEFFQIHDVIDETVSKETFSVLECKHCTLRFTQNVPTQDAIGPYYNAEAYVSHTNSSKGFINSIYHKVRSITLKSKRNLLVKQTGLAKGNLLDIGCGVGAFLNTMREGGWQITGLEPDATARENAAKTFNIQAQSSPVLFDLPKQSFDAITMWHVLEHVHELNAYVNQIAQLLKNDGRAFIAVPNYTSHDAAVYKNRWAAYDVPRHLYHFSPKSMAILLNNHGLKIVTHKPMWFDSFYVALLSEQHKGGGMIKAFFNGLISNLKALFDVKRCSSVIYVVEPLVVTK